MNPEQPQPAPPTDPDDDNSNVEIDPAVMLQTALQVAIGTADSDQASDGIGWLAEKLEGFKQQREQAQV